MAALEFFVGTVFTKYPPNPEKLIQKMREMADACREEDFLRLQTMLDDSDINDDSFLPLKEGMILILDMKPAEEIASTMTVDLDIYMAEENMEIEVFMAAGGFSPTLDIIGTIMGLIRVPSNMTNVAALITSIAVTLLATLYGILFANLLYFPTTNRMKTDLKHQKVYREMMIEGTCLIASGKPACDVGSQLFLYYHTLKNGQKKYKEGINNQLSGDQTVMAGKKERGEAEALENHEKWLLTYSGMITLLLALSMIPYSMSTISAKKFANMAEQAGYQMGVASNSAAVGGGTGNGNGTGIGGGEATTNAGSFSSTMGALDKMYVIPQSYTEKNHLEDQIGLINANTYVRIHLKDKMVFVPNSSRMLLESGPVLKEVARVISKVYNRVGRITSSEYTADIGPYTLSGNQTSWRLSTERAVTVLAKAIGYGVKQDKASIEGYAYFSPVANSNNEEGRAKNRHVEITILRNPSIIPADISRPSPGSVASSVAASGQSESSKAAH